MGVHSVMQHSVFEPLTFRLTSVILTTEPPQPLLQISVDCLQTTLGWEGEEKPIIDAASSSVEARATEGTPVAALYCSEMRNTFCFSPITRIF